MEKSHWYKPEADVPVKGLLPQPAFRLPPPPTAAEKYAVAKRQLTLAAKEKGESVAVLEARKHLGEYLRGIRGGSAARAEIFRAESAGEMLRILAAALSVPPDPDGEI